MNEVTKLYENAGVSCKPNYVYNKAPILSGLKYPPFTAEKQLSLIGWLSDVSSYFSVHCDRYKGMYNVQTSDGGLYVTNNLSEAIASRVNIIWNDLSEKQRTQIKEILE